jgi:hypothetical protein
MGLDESEIEKALSPFGQVDSSLSRTGSGAGLGLTLVDSLMKLHSGSLELFSQKGVGTTVTIVFPAQRVAVQRSASDTERTGGSRKGDESADSTQGGGLAAEEGENIVPFWNKR